MKKFLMLVLVLLLSGSGRAEIVGKQVGDRVDALLDPSAPAWASAAESKVPLLAQGIAVPYLKKATIPELRVKALHNGQWVALRMEWDDATRDAEQAGGKFTDAVAVEFPVSADRAVSPFMGQQGKPVEIVHWKAVWQDDVDQGYRDVEHAYPNMYYDFYPLAGGKKATDIKDRALEYNPARNLKNPVSQVDRKEPCEEMVAVGWGTLTTQKHHGSRARGVHQDGKWSVVIACPLKSKDPTDVVFRPTTPVAFAVWEGSSGNRGGRKHYAMWVDLKLEGWK
ncbi:MAG: ethylbenzene dehydrogenase-related protein [Candidatus Eremiobacterota bacterium]